MESLRFLLFQQFLVVETLQRQAAVGLPSLGSQVRSWRSGSEVGLESVGDPSSLCTSVAATR